jgi:hypothetical protein
VGQPATGTERRLHLGPDEQLVIAGVIPNHQSGLAGIQLRIDRRAADSVDPHDFHPISAAVPIPLHLVELVAEELVKIGRRVAEQQVWARSEGS